MQTEKNSKAVQGIELTKEQMNEQFNIATKELFVAIDFDFVLSTYDYLILAWIGSEKCHSYKKTQRSNVYFFNKELLIFLGKSTSETKDNNLFTEFIDGWRLKKAKEYFQEVYDGFLCTEESDDLTARLDGFLLYKEINRYLKKIYEIDERFKSNKAILN